LDSVGLELRDRACDLCGCPPGTYEKAHHIDHCHETDAVRGVLCTVCNTMLGWVERYKSDPAAIDHYLSKNADYRTVDRES
jgi:hypothetical protein